MKITVKLNDVSYAILIIPCHACHILSAHPTERFGLLLTLLSVGLYIVNLLTVSCLMLCAG